MTRALKDVGKIDLGGIYFVRHDGALLDITPQCVLISITESILNPWLTIRVHINDSINLLGSLPMIGEEYIYVEFKTREDSFNMVKKAFKVSSIENKVRTKSRQDTYSVYGYSVEYFINRNSKVRKTFAGVTPSAIAQNIFSNHLTNVNDGPAGTIVKPFKVWGTDGLTTINAPNMQPLQFIQLLAKKSHAILVDPETGDRSVWADFVFFENMDGFYFYPKSALRAGYGGLGDSFYYAPANQPGGDASYSDEYIEMKAKIEKDLKKFEKSVNSGELTDIAKQLGTSLGAVTGQLGDALSGAAGPLTTALQQGASTLTGVINSIVNGVILDGAGKPRHAELKKDKRFDSSTIIKSIEFNTQGAHQKMNDAGLFHNAIEVIDPIRKSVRRHDWHYESQFGEIGHTGLSQNPVISKNNTYVRLDTSQVTNSRIGYNTDTQYREEDWIIQSVGADSSLDPYLHFADQDNNFVPHRIASGACDDHYTVTATIPGHSMTHAGQIVDIFIPMANDDADSRDKFDPQITNSMGAQFLVETANHIIDVVGEEYETHMTLTKDSYANEVDHLTETESIYPDEVAV